MLLKNLTYFDVNSLDIFNNLKLELIMFNLIRYKYYSILVEIMDYFNILDLYLSYGLYKLDLSKHSYYLYLFDSELKYINTFKFYVIKDIDILNYCKEWNKNHNFSGNGFYLHISDNNNLNTK